MSQINQHVNMFCTEEIMKTKGGFFNEKCILILATIILLIHTQPIDLLASVAARTTVFSADLYKTQIQMVVASSVTLVVLIVLTALSMYKPRGMIRYGQRKQYERCQDVAAVDVSSCVGLSAHDERAI